MALQSRERVRSWRPSKATPPIPWRKRHLPEARLRRRTDDFQPKKIETIDLVEIRPAGPRRDVYRTIEYGSDLRRRGGVDLRELLEMAISAIRNSHFTFEEIRARGGPCPQTLTRWLEERETVNPHLASLVRVLDICDYEITFRPRRRG